MYYQYCDNPQIFTTFYNDFETANTKWATLGPLETLDFNMFCRHVKETMSVAGNASLAFGLRAEKYCYDFAVRKFIIAESAYRPVSWETVSIVDIHTVSADSGKHLELLQPDVSAAAASKCMFDRTDWAVMLSCFACLWQEVVEKFINTSMVDLNRLTEYLGSPAAAESVAAYIRKWGYPPHPYTVVS